jgi:uncharacterized protein (TIGR02246 family)
MLRRHVLALALAAPAARADAPEEEIGATLAAQAEAWNRGDLDAFMQWYDEAATLLGKELHRGRQAVLARYRRDYPDRARMGRTTFSEIEVRLLGPDVALVLGRFRLERAAEHGGEAAGRFTLAMRRSAAGWRILHDHTS